MALARAAVARLLSIGLLSAGWYSALTGLAMVYLALVLAPVGADDAAAPYVALVLFLTGAWQLERGVRSELRARSSAADQPL